MENLNNANKILIFNFLKQHHLAMLATVNSKALPEASVVGYGIKQFNGDFEIHFVTYDSSRKHTNLKRNPSVALVIGWDHGKTVQIEGICNEVVDEQEIKEIELVDLEKMPTVAKYVKPERAVFYKVIPKWLRYSDFSLEPWDRIELKFI